MASQEVKVVGFWVSPFVKRVIWALKLKGIDFEYIEEDIFNKTPLLLKLNPISKKVPVLLHNDKPIVESFIIMEYIDETWNQNPLLPQDPTQRASVRFWAKFTEEKILEAAVNALYSLGEEKEKAVKMAIDGLEHLEAQLKGKKFFGGESIGYLDLVAGWISYALPVFEEVGSMLILDPLKFPSIIKWMKDFTNHPVIMDSLPPRDKSVTYFHKRKEELSSIPHGWIRI